MLKTIAVLAVCGVSGLVAFNAASNAVTGWVKKLDDIEATQSATLIHLKELNQWLSSIRQDEAAPSSASSTNVSCPTEFKSEPPMIDSAIGNLGNDMFTSSLPLKRSPKRHGRSGMDGMAVKAP